MPLKREKQPRPHSSKDLGHHLGVGLGGELVSERLQLGAQLAVVVDLAVVDQPAASSAAGERLVTVLRQIDDGQPVVAEHPARAGRP